MKLAILLIMVGLLVPAVQARNPPRPPDRPPAREQDDSQPLTVEQTARDAKAINEAFRAAGGGAP